MFGKMLSYEIASRLRADLRQMGTVIAILVVTVGVVASGVPGLSGTMTMFGYLMCVAIPVGAAISGMSDYWKTLYGQQGYFTMTLPVSGAVIYWAKASRMIIEFLIAFALAIGGGIAVAWAAAWSQGITLADYTAGPRSLFAPFSTLVLVVLFVAWIVLCITQILQVCAVMSLAAEGRFNHMGFGAVAIGLVLLYIVNQVLSGVGTFFMPFSMTPDGHFSTEVMWTSYRATLGTDGYPNVWGMGACILVPLFALFLVAWASRSIERHTSLR